MTKDSVLAAINLQGILRNMEDLCQMDEDASKLVQGKDVSIRFSVPHMDKLVLRFADGKCTALRNGEKYDMNLHFSSAENLNLMMDGKKNPLPTKGFGHIGFLKNNFTGLADILTAYLRPDEKMLNSDSDFRDKSTILTAYTAFFALSEIGNFDPIGKLNAGRIEDGVISIEVKDSVSVHIIAKDGHLTTVKGSHPHPKAVMCFDSIQTAGGILRGELDSYACIGSGKLKLKGRIPMLDNLNKLLSLVSTYLQ